MSAIPKRVSIRDDNSDNQAFLKIMPTVETHARIQFRHFNEVDREEAVAEAVASAYLGFTAAKRNGKAHRITPHSLAHFSVLQVRDGRHTGGSIDSKNDVMSRKSQRRHGFKVVGLPWDHQHVYDCLRDPTSPVWKDLLVKDKSTPVPDQAAFRIDWSEFLRQQHGRTRTALTMAAEGYKQVDIADKLGVTPAAVCQRVKKAGREWRVMQGENEADDSGALDRGPAATEPDPGLT